MKRFTISLLIILATAALIDPVGHHPSEHGRVWLIQGLLISLSLVVLVLYFQIYYIKDIKPRIPRRIEDIAPVPEAEAYELQKVASKIRLNAVQARILALAILEPGELRERVVERYRPNQRTLDQEVMIEAKVPMRLLSSITEPGKHGRVNHAATDGEHDNQAWVNSDVLFPILVIPKGVFSDNLEVFGADGSRIPILTYREYLQVAARMLRLLLCLAYGISTADDSPKFPRAGLSLDSDPLHLEHRALCEILKRAHASLFLKQVQGLSPVASEASEVADLLEKLSVADEQHRVYLKMAAALVRKLSLHYAIVATSELPADRRMLVKYSRTLIPELELRAGGEGINSGVVGRIYTRFKGWLRVLFGSRPVNVTVSLDNAWTCHSYHMRVDAPEGLYLSEQKLIASQRYLKEKAKSAPTPLHYRFRRRLGQSYAHFYGRFFPLPLPGERRPKIQLGFSEVPPGSDFRATIASCASFSLIWIVGYVLSRNANPGTDAPAFLLLFPGIAASWLGFDTTTHRLFDGTLAARLSLTFTALFSVAASGAFILAKSGLSQLSWSMPSGISVLGVYRWPWAILVAATLANSLYMGCRWLRGAWRFKHLAERPDPDQGY